MQFKLSILLYATIVGFCYGADANEPDTGPMIILEPPSNLLVYSHAGAMIACSAHGKPKPDVYWERANGSAMPDAPRYMKMHPNASLQFLPFSGPLLSSIHHSAYRCVARNRFGTVVSRSVHVKTVRTEDYTDYSVYMQDEHVMRENTAVFTCDIKPDFVRPYVKVTSWLINNQSVSNGKDAIIMGSSLFIRRVNESDNKMQVQCLTVNLMQPNLGKSSLRATLHVREPVQTPPNIDYKKEGMTSRAGADIILPCIAHGYPLAKYTWMKGGRPVKITERIRVMEGDLHIDTAVPADSGVYWCNASNKHGHRVVSTSLSVSEPLSAIMLPRSQKVNGTYPAQMRCVISGEPYSQVSWYKNGQLLSFESNVRRVNSTAIKILSVSRRDAGMYQCLISSSNDNAQASSQLQLGVSAPTFHDNMTASFKRPGDHFSLRCQVYGNPIPTVTWMLAGEPLKNTDSTRRVQVGQYLTTEDDVISHVNISRVEVTDGGRYTCIANNSIGTVYRETQLYVYGPPFVRRMANRTAVANQTLRIMCHASGYPINLTWSREGEKLRNSHKISLTQGGELSISSVEDSDEGYYTCIASNEGKISRASVYVAVIYKPSLRTFQFDPLTQGDSYIADCQVKRGDQPIYFSWYKDNQLISPYGSPGLTVERVSPKMSTLTFSSVQVNDIGNYTCVASNKAGVVNKTAQLHTVYVKPYWIVEPKDSSVVLHSNVVLSCEGGGTPTPTITWKKSLGKSDLQFEAIEENAGNYRLYANGSLEIRNAKRSNGGHFMCQVSNGIGADKSQTVTLTVNVPATFRETDSVREVLVGEDVSLKCDAIGDTPLDTSWSRKVGSQTSYVSLPEPDNDSLKVISVNTKQGRSSTLQMTSVSRSDSGEYWCHSRNQFGTATLLIRLTVKEKPEKVTKLRVEYKESRAVGLSWVLTDDGNSPILHYTVQYSLLEDSWNAHYLAVNSSSRSADITGLLPATSYKFRVIAVNSAGSSEVSEQEEVTTNEEAPSGPPKNVNLQTLSSSSINITWMAPEGNLLNGRLLGYSITYKMANRTGSSYSLMVQNPTTTWHSLINLEPNTSFLVNISAYNSQGQGPSSPLIAGLTYEDLPSQPPVNVTAVVDRQRLLVKWDRPKLTSFHGHLSGYKVIIHSVNERQDESDQRVRTSKSTNLSFTNLSIYTNYSIQVLAYTVDGDGVRSAPIYIMTAPMPPDQPCQVSAGPVNATSILVSWLPPCLTNGIVREYQVTVHSGPRRLRTLSISTPNLRTQILITDLRQGQLYGFTVKAKNYQTVYGKPSSEVTATPTAHVPPMFALMERNVEVGIHKSLVLHCPAVGYPKPSIRWLTGAGQRLPDNFQVFPNDTILVERVKIEDAGSYMCTASNKHGRKNFTISLNVLEEESDLPHPPRLEVYKTLQSSVQVDWTSTDNGGFPITGWLLEWKRGSRRHEVNIDAVTRSYRLTHLACGQTYQIRMRSKNQEGASGYSSPIMAKTKGGKPLAPFHSNSMASASKKSITLDLSGWQSNGCGIIYYSVSYRALSQEVTTLKGGISSSQELVYLDDLESATWYEVEVTAHNSAGSTTISLQVSTLTEGGATIEPWHRTDLVSEKEEDATNVVLLVSLSMAALTIVIIALSVACFLNKRRKKQLAYKGGDKSRHSVFSESSDLDAHHAVRTPFIMPRENLSGDSRMWLLRNPAVVNVTESEQTTPGKAECEYETCTPTLSYARAKMNKEVSEKCVHGSYKKQCHYCTNEKTEEKQLLDVDDLNQFCNHFNSLQLKQHEVCFGPSEDDFPPPPPEALHEYHCEPASKRCTSHEFLSHARSGQQTRPNTTGIRQARLDTPGRISQYPSGLSSMATVSSNQEELLMAYHNSKINPLGPILFESPCQMSSRSAQSSIVTEAGIRMFTQSPPCPEESRQAVCEVPLYATTLPSGCFDLSSDTATDLEPKQKNTRLKSPHRKLYKRKNKRVRNRIRSRDASDELSTNSEDNFPYGIPNHGSSLSSASDNGYGTKTKDTDNSIRTNSQPRTRECGDLYEEEETVSLVQTAMASGETTPPSSLRNLNKAADNAELNGEDTKLIDRYYRTVSTDNTNPRPVELYTEDYTIV